jgi:hypothetical protein
MDRLERPQAVGSQTTAVAAAVAAAVLLGAPPARTGEVLAFDQVRPGMVGVGRTVFEGSRIEDFKVTVLGLLENAVGPRQSLIIARLEGGPLAETGVIAGMSGSPVFVDGKLIGAVAYGFPFSKETIAGITPIGEMIDATAAPAGVRAASARFPLPAGGRSAPLDRETLLAALRRPMPTLLAPAAAGLPPRAAGASLAPLPLPLVFTGFAPSTFEWARGVFSALGFAPVMGGSRTGMPSEPLPALAPGAAVGVSLVEGDLDLSVTGTITHIDGDRVYAFGHPFYNLGPTQFPMKKAYVFSVFPSLYQSFKISAATDLVGTVDQDRTTAIAGRLGSAPRMIPIGVSLGTSRGRELSYALRIVEDELFSPVLAYVSLLSVLQTNERAFGTSTVKVQARLELAGKREVRVEDLFTEQQPAVQAAALVAAPLVYLMSNEHERVTVKGLNVEIASQETIQSATLERAWVEREGPVRPGSRLNLKVLLRTYRGESRTESVPVTLPASLRPGSYTLLVSDAATIDALDQREMRQPFVPRDVDQLIRALNSLRRNNHVYARLTRPDDGAIVAGEYLPALPGSVLSVLGGQDQGGAVVRLRSSTAWDFDLPTDYAVSGARSLTLQVQQ